MKHALLISLAASKQDPALQSGQRGARKILVTELYPKNETEAADVIWQPGSDLCPVQVTPDIEVAIFTQHAAQDRHYHKLGTEFYSVIEGRMVIEIEDHPYTLTAGDMIVVHPGTVHQVKPEGCEFICRVISANCGGISDKYIEPA
ncbi:MAG: cupin domain-containing protein [Nitrosomonadales bacterium]